jgi:hypothetical protein
MTTPIEVSTEREEKISYLSSLMTDCAMLSDVVDFYYDFQYSMYSTLSDKELDEQYHNIVEDIDETDIDETDIDETDSDMTIH